MADMEHRIQQLEKEMSRVQTQQSNIYSEFEKIDIRLTGIVEKKLNPMKQDLADVKKTNTRQAAFIAGAVAAVSVVWGALTTLFFLVRGLFGGG